MLDLSSLLISSAYAQDVAAATPSGGIENTLMQFAPLFIIFAIFYLLLIRPQQKRMAAQEDMLKSLKVGDKVLTGGGLLAPITKIESDDYVQVEIAKDVRVTVARATIAGLAKVENDSANKK